MFTILPDDRRDFAERWRLNGVHPRSQRARAQQPRRHYRPYQ